MAILQKIIKRLPNQETEETCAKIKYLCSECIAGLWCVTEGGKTGEGRGERREGRGERGERRGRDSDFISTVLPMKEKRKPVSQTKL